MIKLAVCDDESYMLDHMEGRISGYMEAKGSAYELTRFSSGQELLDSGWEYDILFLDIQMDAPDGMETAKLLRRQGYRGIIIFITVLKEHVFDAFEVEACDYLLKPVDGPHFAHTLDRAMDALEKRSEKSIMVRGANMCRILPLEEIIYCEVLGRKIFLHTKTSETISYYCKITDLEQSVDNRFFRCHRSYLVNLDHVRELKKGEIVFLDGSRVPVSRLREQELTRAVLSHMKERRF